MKVLAFLFAVFAASVSLAPRSTAQVPNLINHQGRIAVGGVNYTGTGQFKFALVNGDGSVTFWSNDGTSTAGSEPTAAVSLNVTKGLYSLLLGDTALPNMTSVPASVWNNADVRVRVWFNDGVNGFQLLTPDQRLASTAYLADGAITSAKLAPGATPPPVIVSGTQQTAASNASYVASSNQPTEFTLPATAAIGDMIQITGRGIGGWFVPGLDHEVWQPRNVVSTWVGIASSADGMRLVATLGGGIRRSTNGGRNWAFGTGGGGNQSVASSADGLKLIVAQNLGRLLTSADGGVSWTTRATTRYWTGVASSSDGVKLVAVAAGTPFGGGVFTSGDSGETWTPRIQGGSWAAVACSADGNKILIGREAGALAISSDSGATWTDLSPSGSWKAAGMSADGSIMAAVGAGTPIYIGAFGGFSWSTQDSARNWSAITVSADGARMAATVRGGRIHTWRQGHGSWTARENTREWTGIASSSDGRLLAATAMDDYIYTSAPNLAEGGPGTAATLQHVGGGVWQRVGAADGSVSARSLAADVGVWSAAANGVYRQGGNVGIGTTDPRNLLSLGSSVSPTKFALWEGGTNVYGLGIGAQQMRFHVDQPSSRFTFLDAPQGNEILNIKGTGEVGIGVADPVTRLDIDTGGAGRVQIRNEDNFVPALNVTGGPLPGYLRMRHSFEIWPNDEATAPGRMDIRNTAGAATITLDGGAGSLGLGRIASANRLEVEGEASKSTAGAWLANSDRRIKTDVAPVQDALNTLDKVTPVTFRYTDDYRRDHPTIADVPYYNVIAQEFREVFPNAVKSSGERLPDGSEILQVDTYPAMITAIAAIKELKSENEQLRAELAAARDQINAIARRLDGLEKPALTSSAPPADPALRETPALRP